MRTNNNGKEKSNILSLRLLVNQTNIIHLEKLFSPIVLRSIAAGQNIMLHLSEVRHLLILEFLKSSQQRLHMLLTAFIIKSML